jgi:hypothetical protein
MPAVDTIVDDPYWPDERKFMRVAIAPTPGAYVGAYVQPVTDDRSQTAVGPGQDMVVFIYLENSAHYLPCEVSCSSPEGSQSSAHGVRVRVDVWRAPNEREFIVRGWVEADDTDHRCNLRAHFVTVDIDDRRWLPVPKTSVHPCRNQTA